MSLNGLVSSSSSSGNVMILATSGAARGMSWEGGMSSSLNLNLNSKLKLGNVNLQLSPECLNAPREGQYGSLKRITVRAV